jgi:hypothetical protein
MKFLRAVIVFAVGVLAVATLLAPRAAWAAEAATAAPASADAAILPYIDVGTFLVGRLDIEKVDADSLEANFDQMAEAVLLIEPIPDNQKERMRGEARNAAGKVKDWVSEMKNTGVKHVYLLLDTADFFAGTDDPIFVAPLPAGANDDAVGNIGNLLDQSRQHDRTEKIGDAIVFGVSKQRDRLKKRFEPGAAKVERPEVATALAAAGDAPARMALVPSEAARKFIEQALPKLPDMFGGAETKVVSRGVAWASAAVTQKPDANARLTVRAADADHAKALFEAITKGTEATKEKIAGGQNAEELGKILESIKPKQTGHTITLDVNPVLLISGVKFAGEQLDSAARGTPKPGQPPATGDGGL